MKVYKCLISKVQKDIITLNNMLIIIIITITYFILTQIYSCNHNMCIIGRLYLYKHLSIYACIQLYITFNNNILLLAMAVQFILIYNHKF